MWIICYGLHNCKISVHLNSCEGLAISLPSSLHQMRVKNDVYPLVSNWGIWSISGKTLWNCNVSLESLGTCLCSKKPCSSMSAVDSCCVNEFMKQVCSRLTLASEFSLHNLASNREVLTHCCNHLWLMQWVWISHLCFQRLPTLSRKTSTKSCHPCVWFWRTSPSWPLILTCPSYSGR